MKVIAVVGTASGSGKTTLACAILRSIPGLGAVKISPRDGPPRAEWGAGDARRDTARFAASGARTVARIVAPRERVAEVWAGIRDSFQRLPGVVVEGAGALALPEERFTILVVNPDSLGVRPDRDAKLVADADWIVVSGARGASGRRQEVVAALRAGPMPMVEVLPGEGLEPRGDRLLAALRRFVFDAPLC